jgi:hypothetical protein
MASAMVWGLIAGLLTAAGPACAGTISTDLDLTTVDITQPGLQSEGVIPRFDPDLGTLTGVTLTVDGTITGQQTGSPLLEVEFADQADHIFNLYGEVFTTSGQITPQGVSFSIDTDSADAAANAAIFNSLYPGTTLELYLFAINFTGAVTFETDTLNYTYTPVAEPWTVSLLLGPVLGLCVWRSRGRRRFGV